MILKKYIVGACIALLTLASCTDTLKSVGMTIQPDSDRIFVYSDTFHMKASTIKMDSIYARTRQGILGYFDDPKYGSIKAEYMCQFYCPEDYKFAHTPHQGKIDSVDFKIFYSSWIGDSITSMQAQLYMVSKPLDRDYYTNIDPTHYSDMSKFMAEATYTAYDKSISDSIHKLPQTDINYYIPRITFQMPDDFGQKFYESTLNNRAAFKNQDTFNEFFPGIYVKQSYGVGNMINVDNSCFTIYYKYMLKDIAGKDSLASYAEVFNVTKEVIQLNKVENAHTEELLIPNEEFAYIKSPAGVCTRIEIPAKEINKNLKGRIVNNVPLTLKTLPQEGGTYALNPPTNLLLVMEDSVKTFFEDAQIENNKSNFISNNYDPYTRTYTFPNLANLLKNHAETYEDKDLVMLVVPVVRSVGQNQSSGYYSAPTTYTTAISHYMRPSAVTILKDEESMKVAVTSSKYNDM